MLYFLISKCNNESLHLLTGELFTVNNCKSYTLHKIQVGGEVEAISPGHCCKAFRIFVFLAQQVIPKDPQRGNIQDGLLGHMTKNYFKSLKVCRQLS